MTYRELIRSFQNSWKEERGTRKRMVAKPTFKWDIAPERDVDQSKHSQKGLWEVSSEVDLDDDVCQFFQVICLALVSKQLFEVIIMITVEMFSYLLNQCVINGWLTQPQAQVAHMYSGGKDIDLYMLERIIDFQLQAMSLSEAIEIIEQQFIIG